jgi:hypothetical protein
MAMNSAPMSKNSAAALKNAKIRNNTEWTGLRDVTTMTADRTVTVANK